MLELKNVSKYYYQKNTVASGFSKINLKLQMGEFVVITGESGSGKSTLLNVISGLDSYEEGEMYINEEETSGYNETDFENYRKKYIGNIFQSFNLVNSYTVYQNIELVLLINGYKKSEIKEKIIEVIKQVDLLKYKNTKVSKLSGGQKQRVAIARALVKDTPILVADEPTGNLDSKSAQNIMELLHQVAKNKLMILVTHNYEQVESYATRKITMHDGRIVEDKKIKTIEEKEDIVTISESKKMRITSKIRLGIRNTFNIIPKFLLLLMVYLILSLAVLAGYSSLKKQDYEKSKVGYNDFFREISDKRIVIKKKDKNAIQKEEFDQIAILNNVDYVIESDLLLDQYTVAVGESFSFLTKIADEKMKKNEIQVGRMPENDNEVILEIEQNGYMTSQLHTSILEKEFTIPNIGNESFSLDDKFKVVGALYAKKETNQYNNSTKLYFSTNQIDNIRSKLNTNYSQLEMEVNGHIFTSKVNNRQYRVVPNSRVPKGKAYVFEEINGISKKNNAKNHNLKIKVDNVYYQDELTLKIDKTYNKKNMKKLLNLENYDMYQNVFFVNPEDYYPLFNKENYQSSVFVKDEKEVPNTIERLNQLGYETLYVKDTIVNYNNASNVIVEAITLIVVVISIAALFFLSYFVIKIILKSRNVYYSTIRILGATRKNAKQLLRIELMNVLNIAYAFMIGFSFLIKEEMIKIEMIKDLLTYLHLQDYILLYIVLVIVSILISNRYAKQLFKKSAMNTYREEV